ncbi:MAG TPA: hypothetical protein VKJ00_11030, partial [Thermoanaerobaculia bacterium]|nr:hypothetical protein [Thermoanaerobaculia bacterium]
MQRERVRTGALIAAVMVAGVSLAAPPAVASAPRPADTITPLLEQRIKTGRVDDVVVDIRWPFQTGRATCRISGDGVGLWDRRVQFRLPPKEISSLLESVARSGFGSLPKTIGGTPNVQSRQKGQFTLSVGAATKTVVQLETGDQSTALEGLAEAFLRASASAA